MVFLVFFSKDLYIFKGVQWFCLEFFYGFYVSLWWFQVVLG